MRAWFGTPTPHTAPRGALLVMLHTLRRRARDVAAGAHATRASSSAVPRARTSRARRPTGVKPVELPRIERTTLPARADGLTRFNVPHALYDHIWSAHEHKLAPMDVLSPAAARVCAEVRRSLGKNVYCVGGAVRDATRYGTAALARDIDLVTDATYGEIRRAFGRRVRFVGRRFRVALVRERDEVVELASFSTSVGDADGAGDDDVDDGNDENVHAFDDTKPRTASGEIDFDAVLRRRRGTRTEEEVSTSWKATKSVDGDGDLMRLVACKENAMARDFTVNALYYDPFRNEMLDFTGGVYDTIAGIVRCVDDTPKSLREDPVRMLRAIRLAARHGFTMTKELRAGLRAYAPMLTNASSMRVTQEIRTLMHGGYSETTMKLFWHSTLMKVVFPTQYEFLVKRLPTAKTLTYELDSTFTTSKRDVDGGVSLFFNALKAYDDVVKSRGAAERHRERPVAEWLALLAAPIAMTRLLEHDAFKGASSTLPAPWRGGATPESAPELFAQWEAFTGAVLDVLEDMSSEGHASANPEALDVFVKGDLSAALLILLARGPMFASNDERASGDALGWYHADFLSPRIASAAHTARIKPYAKTKKVGWFQASFYPNDIDLIRACLAAPKP